MTALWSLVHVSVLVCVLEDTCTYGASVLAHAPMAPDTWSYVYAVSVDDCMSCTLPGAVPRKRSCFPLLLHADVLTGPHVAAGSADAPVGRVLWHGVQRRQQLQGATTLLTTHFTGASTPSRLTRHNRASRTRSPSSRTALAAQRKACSLPACHMVATRVLEPL